MTEGQPVMRQGGWFEAAGRRLLGELTIDGQQTNLFVHDPQFFHVTDNDCRCIHGTLHDLRKVTLVNCHAKEMGVQSGAKEQFHYHRFTPHYVLLGHQHLDPDENVITRVSLLVDDAEAVFPDFDAFGTASQPKKHSVPAFLRS